MKTLTFLIIFSICFAFNSIAYSSPDGWIFIDTPDRDGLPDDISGIPYLIAVNSLGSVYIRTVNTWEANRYTYHIELFENDSWTVITSEKFNYPFEDATKIYDFCFGRNGSIWLSSEIGLINYDAGKWYNYPIVDEEDGINREYGQIAADSTGGILIASRTAKRLKPNDPYSTILTQELVRFQDGKFELLFVTDTTNRAISLRAFNMIEDISTAPNGDLWFCSLQVRREQGGLFKYGGDSLYVYDLKSSADPSRAYPSKLTAYKNDEIWISYIANGTTGRYGGFSIFDGYEQWEHWSPGKGLPTRDTIQGLNKYSSFAKGRDGVIWLGTTGVVHWGNGVVKLDNGSVEVIHLGELFDLDYGGVLYANEIHDIEIDHQNRVWFATSAGLFMYDPSISSTSSDYPSEAQVKCYPNPALPNQQVIMSVRTDSNTRNSDVNLFLCDMAGRKQKTNISNVIHEGDYSYVFFNTTGLSTGTYYIELILGNERFTHPIIISN